jgi:hypothetical protein
MSTIQQLFLQAQLAEAAYADLSGITPSTDPTILQSRLINAQPDGEYDFSPAQAYAFVTEWVVVNHIPDTVLGFSASLFRNTAGEYSLAIRGSTPDSLAVDFLADAGDIFLDGVVLDQLVDMYNYWQHLRSPTGIYEAKKLVTLQVETALLRAANLVSDEAGATYEAALRLRLDVLVDKPTSTVRTIQSVNSFELADERLRAGAGVLLTEPSSITVSGHSLGGHLAMAFTRLFGSASLDAEATAVNGLGFRTGNSNADNLFFMLGGAGSFNATQIQNIYGTRGFEFAAMNNLVLQQPGAYEGIFIESAGPAQWGGHKSAQMTDSLAVYDLFATVGSHLNDVAKIPIITDILNATSNVAANSLERTVSAIGKL